MSDSLRLFLIFSSILCVTFACSDDELYVIRSGAFQGLVLDGANPNQITIEFYKNVSSQLWQFEAGDRPGLYYIVNYESGQVLDYVLTDTLALVTRPKRSNLRQQWSITMNKRITNAENERSMDIAYGRFTAGTRLIVYETNGNQGQELVIVKYKVADLQDWKERLTEKLFCCSTEKP